MGVFKKSKKQAAVQQQMMDQQNQQIADARARDEARTQRLTQGKAAIDQIFGGIGDDFYNQYKEKQIGMFMPQLERQYGQTKDTLNYDLARAGTLNSSIATKSLSDLAYENDLARANIYSKADAAAGELRNQVASNKQNVLNQLYATEDPNVAANTATNMVSNTQLTQPQGGSLGQMFSSAAIGVGSGLNNYANAQATNNVLNTLRANNTQSGKSYAV